MNRARGISLSLLYVMCAEAGTYETAPTITCLATQLIQPVGTVSLGPYVQGMNPCCWSGSKVLPHIPSSCGLSPRIAASLTRQLKRGKSLHPSVWGAAGSAETGESSGPSLEASDHSLPKMDTSSPLPFSLLIPALKSTSLSIVYSLPKWYRNTFLGGHLNLAFYLDTFFTQFF